MLVWAAQHVVGFTTDSDAYLDVAWNIRAGHGLVQWVVDFWRPGIPDPLGMWPPLYPALIAAVSAFGVPLEFAALLVTGASFVAFAVAFHALAFRLLGRDVAVAVTILALSTLGVAACSAYAWSEATYLALVTAGLARLAPLLAPSSHAAEAATAPPPDAAARARGARRRRALEAGALFGAAALTRYAGMPVAVACALYLVASRATRDLAVPFACTALVVPGLWLARDLVLFGHPFGPALPASAVGATGRAAELVGALRWELLGAPIDRIAALATLVGILLVAGIARAFVRPGPGRAVAGFAVLLMAVVVAATATSAINAPGGRYVAPALPFLFLAAISGLRDGARPKSGRHFAVVVLAVALAACSFNEFVKWGKDRPKRAVLALDRRSERALLARIVPPGTAPVLSDAGHALRLATGRPAVQIPPAAYRPRALDAADLARWKAHGVRIAVVRRVGESELALRGFGAHGIGGAGPFVVLELP